jgi:hypothetical protein
MDFVAFPFRVEARGWLARSASRDDSLVQLLAIIARTPERGWVASASFGSRDTLASIRSRQDTRLKALKQMNEMLKELGVDWVKIEGIEFETPVAPHELSYTLTLDLGQGAETHRIQI